MTTTKSGCKGRGERGQSRSLNDYYQVEVLMWGSRRAK